MTVIEPEELRRYLAELAETVAVHHGVQHKRPFPQRGPSPS